MSVHEDTLKGLHEVLEYTKGNLELKTSTIEIPDEEMWRDLEAVKELDNTSKPAVSPA